METVAALKSRLKPALYKIAAGMPLPTKNLVKVPKPAAPKPFSAKPAAKASPVPGGKGGPMAAKSAAYRIGYAQQCMEKLATLLPKPEVVDAVSKRTGVPAEVIKLACLRKTAAPMLPGPAAAAGGGASRFSRFMPKTPLGLMLGAAAIPLLGIPAAKGVGNYIQRGLSGYGWGGGGGLLNAPHMGTIGGFDPKTTSQLQKMIAMEGMRNAQLSSLLQGIRGAYQPAGNPWGYSAAPRPMM